MLPPESDPFRAVVGAYISKLEAVGLYLPIFVKITYSALKYDSW